MVWPFLPPQEHLAISEDIFGYPNWECATGITPKGPVGRGQDAVKHPTMHRTVPTTKNGPT